MIHRRKLIVYVLAVVMLFAVPFFAGCAGCQREEGAVEEQPAPAPEPEPAPAPEVKPMPAPEPAPQPAPAPAPEPPPPTINASDFFDVFFAFDKSDLTPEARDKLQQNADLLKKFPMATILIEGHCDERGTNEYNLGLGERRAAAAKNYLVSLGVNAGRIETISYGEERPFATGHNEEAWKQNRRAHFKLK